jgi:uncharacterized protein YdhG (YjbR/CyaY superfamily)
MMKSAPPPNVDAYLDGLSDEKRKVLEHLRQVIKSAAPEAEEVISYQIPAYKYHGILCYFAAYEKHFSLFAVHKELFLDELKDFKTSKGTIQFTADKQLPDDLVRRIVRHQVAENEATLEVKKATKKVSKASKPKY